MLLAALGYLILGISFCDGLIAFGHRVAIQQKPSANVLAFAEGFCYLLSSSLGYWSDEGIFLARIFFSFSVLTTPLMRSSSFTTKYGM